MDVTGPLPLKLRGFADSWLSASPAERPGRERGAESWNPGRSPGSVTKETVQWQDNPGTIVASLCPPALEAWERGAAWGKIARASELDAPTCQLLGLGEVLGEAAQLCEAGLSSPLCTCLLGCLLGTGVQVLAAMWELGPRQEFLEPYFDVKALSR